MTSVGSKGGLAAPPKELSMFVGLVNPPFEDGDRGTPLTVDGSEGDLERSSEVRRKCGVAPV